MTGIQMLQVIVATEAMVLSSIAIGMNIQIRRQQKAISQAIEETRRMYPAVDDLDPLERGEHPVTKP